MAEHERFYVVVQAGPAEPVARVFDDLVEADKAAQALAINNQGETFVVFSPGDAYRSAKPRAEKVWLAWKAEAATSEPPPAPPPTSDIAEVAAEEPAF